MSVTPRWGALAGAAALVTGLLAGCAGSGERLAGMVTPYRADVVQGNFVSREQVEALRPGMSRQQVREVLGTPLLTSVFHADRWEYVFTLRRQGVETQARHLTVFFKDNRFERVEGDEMPTEEEFVASLGSRLKDAKAPALEASEAQLERFPKAAPAAAEGAKPAAPPAGTRYPPLEPSGR